MDERENDGVKEPPVGDPVGNTEVASKSVMVPEATKPSGAEATMSSDEIAENPKPDSESTATATATVTENASVLEDLAIEDTCSSEDMSFSATEVELLRHKCSQLESSVTMMKHELESEVAVAQCVKDSLIDLQRQKKSVDEEVETLNQLLSEAHMDAAGSRTLAEHDMAKAQAIIEQLKNENHELRIQMKLGGGDGLAASSGVGGVLDRDMILGGAAVISDATKSFARRMKSNLLQMPGAVGATSPHQQQPQPQSSANSLEENMRKAYEDAELLKSIVVPLEEQIAALKEKLRDTDTLLREHEERQVQGLLTSEALGRWLGGQVSLDEAATQLLQKADSGELAEERKAASDLNRGDVYLGLMGARYSILSAELGALRKERAEVVSLLERERATTKALRRDAGATSSDLVRLQREHLAERMRIQAVLTEEQKAEIAKPQSASASVAGASTTSVGSSGSTDSSPTSSPVSDESVAAVTSRLVTNVEWEAMHQELARVRMLFGMAAGGGDAVGSEQFKQLQTELIEIKKQRTVLAKSEERLKQELKNESVFRREVEDKWNERAEQHKSETEALNKQMQELEGLLEQLRISYSTVYEASRKDLHSLTADREKIVRELRRLQEENDLLVGKHTQKAQEMQNEVINLPDNAEDMQLLLLRYREELITAKLAKERIEEKLRSEVKFIKAQLSGEQQAKEAMEDQLSAEIESLKQKLYQAKEKEQELLRFRRELDEEHKKRREAEGSELKQKESFANLRSELEGQMLEKQKLEAKLFEMKNRVTNLQQELDNSVAVQTDFVRLSQSLQMELEKIRQSEKEVRFQCDEDISDCQNCRVGLAERKKKHHCRHCGRIFCSDCVSKSVMSGPNRRPAKVCDVCHTLLVQHSAPYFSTEAPHNN